VDSRRLIPRRLALGAGGLALLAACSGPRVLSEDGSVDLLTMLRDKPEHRRFVNAITVAGLAGRVGRPNGAVTLFVPTDEGMGALPADLLRLLDSPPSSPTPEQRAAVARIVNANAAFGLLRLDDFEPRRNQVVTWDRGRVQVTRTGPRTGTVVREGAPAARPVTITRGDILGSDGVYHVTSAPVVPA
jgi:hypothetical protein